MFEALVTPDWLKQAGIHPYAPPRHISLSGVKHLCEQVSGLSSVTYKITQLENITTEQAAAYLGLSLNQFTNVSRLRLGKKTGHDQGRGPRARRMYSYTFLRAMKTLLSHGLSVSQAAKLASCATAWEDGTIQLKPHDA